MRYSGTTNSLFTCMYILCGESQCGKYLNCGNNLAQEHAKNCVHGVAQNKQTFFLSVIKYLRNYWQIAAISLTHSRRLHEFLLGAINYLVCVSL
jgi:transcription termination factor NusB